MRAIIDLHGQRFGRLTVTAFSHSDKWNQANWLCRCDCGTEKSVQSKKLRNGNTQSCGCLRRELLTVHGHCGLGERSPEHRCWTSMIQRCYNPKTKQYEDYGGRGIWVCDEWRHSFEAFFRDMGLRPRKDLTLERINNNGGYEKNNCRWATRKEQRNNQRPARLRHDSRLRRGC